jgi:hypothetical protein
VSLNLPPLVTLVINGLCNPRVELYVSFEFEFVRDKMQIPLDFRLRREMLAPVPFVYEFLGEGVLVGIALRVEACPRITIPVPGSADIAASLKDPCREPKFTELIESV